MSLFLSPVPHINLSLILKLLSDNSSGFEHNRNRWKKLFLRDKPKERLEIVKDLCEKGVASYKTILHLLDLKQKQANVFEARSGTKMVPESKKFNETIMLVSCL
jgi:hypothetical protein